MSHQRLGVLAACVALALVCVIVVAHKNDFIALVVEDVTGEPIAVVDIESDGTDESSQSFRVIGIRPDGTTKDITMRARADVPPGAPFTYKTGTVNARALLYGDAWLVLRDQDLSVAVQVSVARKKPIFRSERRELGVLDESDEDYIPSHYVHIYDPGEPVAAAWIQQDDEIHRPDEGPSVVARLGLGTLAMAILVISFVLVRRPKRKKNPWTVFTKDEDLF